MLTGMEMNGSLYNSEKVKLRKIFKKYMKTERKYLRKHNTLNNNSI